MGIADVEDRKQLTKPSDSCHDSHYGSSVRERILKFVNDSDIEVTPKEISDSLGINHSTARNFLRDLYDIGKISQPYHGAYCSNRMHAVRFVPVRVHNLVLSVPAPWLDFTDEVVEMVGSVKIRVQYGIDRRRITGFISCDGGMDKDALLFAVDKFIDIVKSRTNRVVESVVVRTVEINRDYLCVNLKDAQCITRKRLVDVLERIYQRESNVVRHEFKISREMSVDELLALVQSGASSYDLQQGVFMIDQRLESLTEVVKFVLRLLKPMLDRLPKEVPT